MVIDINTNNIGTLLEQMISVRADEIEQELRQDTKTDYQCNLIKAETLHTYLSNVDKENYQHYLELMDIESENYGILTERSYIQGFKDGLSLLIYAIGTDKTKVFGRDV